ncbi:flagellar basal body-associated FliL family protein [Desulfovibrio mangrovi]|uniref:flagellar basal body-associated FliL family protein n=1 Tax=Desulfovibrio mangrovi TaxID=2976983 RepID=UPI002246B51B|nr:flagellar basal body-associated FliL family protein [Desulfovibrio mangrovi]UZP66230.1 flagellar basal body-associated FliL family protein [Desulfovibrio mangrovi]
MADEDKEKKKGGAFKWIILLLLLLILLGGGGFIAWKYFLSKPAADAEPQQVQMDQGAQGEVSPKDAQVVTLPTFLVNLADPLGRRYIKLTLDVEVVNPDVAAELEGAQAKVRDAVILLLSSKSYADLAPLENKILLKNELVTRLNQILGGSKVVRVYFTELVIQ